jgi:two-component system cell cycle sensor histidine kinase PleC
MAQDALRQSFVSFPPRAADGMLRPLARVASVKAGILAGAFLRLAARQAQPLPLAIGLPALAVSAVSAMGYLSLGAVAGASLQAIAAGALALAVANGRRIALRLEVPAQSYSLQSQAVAAAGGAVLRWNLVDGDLTWLGDAQFLFEGRQVPLSFRDLRSHLHPEDSLYNSISDALKAQARYVCWTLRLKDGGNGWRTFNLHGEIACGEADPAPVFSGVLIPAEAPVAAEATGETGRMRLAALIESLPMSFAIWDNENRLQLCNRKFRQLYRIPPNAALPGTSVEDMQGHAQEPLLQRPSNLGSAPGRFQRRDVQLADGTWLQICEYRTGDGIIASVGSDITVPKLGERRLLEREQEMRATVAGYEQSRRQLEVQARQLRELAERFNDEKIRAEAASRSKSEFLANVSHELRTPLNAIIGFSDMMRDGVLGPIGNQKYAAYVNDINTSGRYLLEMIDSILDMAKIEAGRATLAPQWVALGPLFAECLRVVHPAAIERRIELLGAGATPISVFADKRALKQILINLLANAVKFTLPGGKVLLRAYRYRGTVRIAITDTGVGIAKHELVRLGRPFEQAQNQLTKEHKGTGLGLAISRSLAELHGGKLDIKSKTGEGTTVTCILPGLEEKALTCEAA